MIKVDGDQILCLQYKSGAKNLFIGIDYKNGFTFDHYFEEKIGVDYRYFKYLNQITLTTPV